MTLREVFPHMIGPEAVYTGIPTRDYIAIQAMIGLLAGNWAAREDIADFAYKIADAMIKQSEVKE